MGIDPIKADWGTVLRLLDGIKGADGKRVFGSGMRHFAANKARVLGHALECSTKTTPSQFIILPIRTTEQCCDWNGENYEAIVLVGTDKDGGGQKAISRDIGVADIERHKTKEADEGELLFSRCIIVFWQWSNHFTTKICLLLLPMRQKKKRSS